MNVGEAVKERILELCRERDISINKLCTMSGVTQSTVNNIVSGRNKSVTISTIKKLCAELQRRGCDIGRTTYAKYESGELNIRASVLIELRKIYNCSYDDFFEGLEKTTD